MILDVEALIAPLSDEQPAGPDLYGDLKRQQIEQAFERSVSDGAPADQSASMWQDTIDLIIEQCEITRDLWLPVYLMRAAVRAGQFDLLVEASGFLAALIEARWNDVHPQLEDLGFIGRKAPCEALVRIGDFLGPLERMPIVTHPRAGSFSGADFERFREKGAKASGFSDFSRALEAIGPQGLQQALEGIDAIMAAIRSVDATLSARAEGDTGTNFRPTYELLGKMHKAVVSFMPQSKSDASPDPGLAEAAEESNLAEKHREPAATEFSGGINSRDDVVKAIDAICLYYARYEPGSPVPFVLRRARDWISLDFMAVLADIAPGSLDEAARVLKGQVAEVSSGGDWGSDSSNHDESDGESYSPDSEDDSWG